MDIKFNIESFDQCYAEGKELFPRHKEELGSFKESILEPDEDLHRLSNEKGLLYFFTVRDEGKLIGYAAYWLHRNTHYISEKWAQSDTIIVMPEYRNMGVGDQFYDYIEEQCKKLGAKVIQTTVRADHIQGRALGMLLTRHGCARLNVGYAKRFT